MSHARLASKWIGSVNHASRYNVAGDPVATVARSGDRVIWIIEGDAGDALSVVAGRVWADGRLRQRGWSLDVGGSR